ncbi:NAD-dependent protein deacylase [Methanococcoides methylutens]|uniref:NAD-dependent protein deacetylase of SIR2 family n=1 Tax=Methanococcoides methylutens MM1 TaxID=1434104 RepID=A0A0E3SR85_METMT|nr:NAD-dependent protein deacylase [Methanococcoides methylutens]AKB85366.1 NAD-dependent protein deacetylase of SIR2 family [Methanococcoides methylutens MM1]
MQELLTLLQNSKYCVILTGAGISTLSGIPDFRGKDGIYNKFDADLIFSIDYFNEDPSYFYTHSRELIYDLERKEPNIIHKALAELERRGIVKAVITQNIDMLHQRAGSENVIEVHGSPARHTCLACGKKYSFEEVVGLLEKEEVPMCNECGGLIKPDVVFYGEMLEHDVIEKAIEESSRADLIIVLGSTLVVQPAATLPLYTLDHGGELVIVNNMPTPLDDYARSRYDDLVEVFNYLNEEMGLNISEHI